MNDQTVSNPPIPEERIGEFQSLLDIVARLRGPGGCPWDAEQTHESLKRNLLEECYETLEAIDAGHPAELADELGDILVQVAFHADIAHRAGEFDIADVLPALTAAQLIQDRAARQGVVIGPFECVVKEKVENGPSCRELAAIIFTTYRLECNRSAKCILGV